MQVNSYEINGKYREFYSQYYIPTETKLYGLSFKEKSNEFHFIFSSLNAQFNKDIKKLLEKDCSQDNIFIEIRNLFLSVFEYLLNFFPSADGIDIFKYPSFNMFLTNSPEEFLSFGSRERLNLPVASGGRVVGLFLVYSQDSFTSKNARNFNFSKNDILGDAHELFHILQNSQLIKNKYMGYIPFLFSEGLSVICGNQLSKKFNEDFISKENLFLGKRVNPFDFDKRMPHKNVYYQSAGHFMDYLLKLIAKNMNISYEGAFQLMFLSIGSKDSLNINNNFDSRKFMQKCFSLNIDEEYKNFIQSFRSQ